MNTEIKREELLISQLADLLVHDKHVAVGAASPIPGAAALLAKEEAKAKNRRLRVTILHSNKYNNFTDGAAAIGIGLLFVSEFWPKQRPWPVSRQAL